MKFFTAMAMMAASSRGGLFDVGWGVGLATAAAVASDGEDWKGVLAEEFVAGDGVANLAATWDAEDRQDKLKAEAAIRSSIGKLGHATADDVHVEGEDVKGVLTGEVHLQDREGEVNLAETSDTEDPQAKPKALGAIKKLVGRFRRSAETEDSTKLRGSKIEIEDGGEPVVKNSSDGKKGDVEFGHEVEFLSEYEEARANYAHIWTEHSLAKIHQDYKNSGLNGDPEKELPSYDEVRKIYEKMYDSFHKEKFVEVAQVDPSNTEDQDTDPEDEELLLSMPDFLSLSMVSFDDDEVLDSFENPTNATANGRTAVSEDEALLFVNGRLTANDWSSTFQEVMACQDMFTGSETGIRISDEGSMDLSLEDVAAVGEACFNDRNKANLEAIGFDPDTFCPLFARLMPLHFQVLGDVITHNVTSFCSFLVDTLFETAGEPECAHRIEEVQLVDAISLGTRYSFPLITNTSTFESSYATVCTDHETPYFYDPEDCASSMESVIQVSTQLEPEETMISYLSNLCDAMGLPLPHPNETIRVRYDNPHVSHKPGGKPNLKIRHMMSDLFNYVGHYKHGFMDKYGKYIEHPSDTLLDPEAELVASEVDSSSGMTCDQGARRLNPKMTCAQRNMYCSGLAFSVGAGASVSAGPLSLGGGVDFGFGIADNEATMYEETFVWGICGSESLVINAVDPSKAEAQKSAARKKMESKDVGVSVGISAGGWTNTGHIPGFADTITISVNILGVEIGFTLIETFAQDFWIQSNGFHGFLLEVGASFPPSGPLSADLDQAKCYGKVIESDKNAATVFPRQYTIDLDARWSSQVCGPNTFSFNIESTSGSDNDSTKTGLSLYYYKNQWDWDNRKNRRYIVHYCGNKLQNNKLTTMGHGDHFTTHEVYGVGIAAHGNDNYNLGVASLYQAVGGNKWVQKWSKTDVNLCIATNTNGCYPNIEIKIHGETSELFWRSGSERVSKYSLCPQKPIVKVGKYTQDFKLCDWKENFSCGSGQTMRLNPCGTSNSDQVYNIDEKAACKSCAQNLQDNNLINSGWTCSDQGWHQWNINYKPVTKTKRVHYKTTCRSGYIKCYGNVKAHITRDGKWHQDRVWNIKGSWEYAADKCCRYLKDKKYVTSCSRKHIGHGMDIKYKSTSSCTNHYRYESICDWRYNVGCGNDMSIKVLNPCGSWNHDGVNNLWRGGCKRCGKNLYDNGHIKSGYSCTENTFGSFLKYTPIEKYEPRTTKNEVYIQFDSTHWLHSNTIDGIDDGFSWEGACKQAKSYLENNGYIEKGAYCQKNFGFAGAATSIWLNYKPKADWYPISTTKATGSSSSEPEKYQCDKAIANKGSWCSGTSDKIKYHRCDGKPVNVTNHDYATHLLCNGGPSTMKCSDFKTSRNLCFNPFWNKNRFRETWPECKKNHEYLKADNDVIDYDPNSGLIPRNEVVQAILDGVQEVSADIFGDGTLHKIFLGDIEILDSYKSSDPELVLAFSIFGAVLEQYPDSPFNVFCGDAADGANCQVVRAPHQDQEDSGTQAPSSSPELFKSCNIVAKDEDIPLACRELDYTVALYAFSSPHFSLVATLDKEARNDSSEVDCPQIISFHSLDGEKKRHFVDESLAQDLPHYTFGAAKLGDILRAEEQADAIQDSEFDIATKNCVHFAGSMWRSLGFAEDMTLAKFLIEHVVNDDAIPYFLKSLRDKQYGNGFKALAALALGKDSLKSYFADVVYSQLMIKEQVD